MLHPETGPTDANIGLDHMLSVLLKPMRVAVKQLQTIGQPIQHRVARVLRKLQLFYRSLLTADALSYEEPHASWRRLMSVPAISKIAGYQFEKQKRTERFVVHMLTKSHSD